MSTEESVWQYLPSDIIAELVRMTRVDLGTLDRATYEKLKAQKFFPQIQEAIKLRRSKLLFDIETELEQTEGTTKRTLMKFHKLVQANLFVNEAPDPPTLFFMNEILDISWGMYNEYREKGVKELEKLILNRVYLWSSDKRVIQIVETPKPVKLTEVSLEIYSEEEGDIIGTTFGNSKVTETHVKHNNGVLKTHPKNHSRHP
jgi:hypothetical protein